MEEKRIKHYSSYHKILLVGEGDISFSLCLAKAFGTAANMVATSLDSREGLKRKYSKASTNLDDLEGFGCTILHEVDAHIMSSHPLLQNTLFDRIIFNFPHARFTWREHELLPQIELHQNVVRGFLSSAIQMITEKGEIHVTHKTAHSFSNWEIEKLASNVGLCLVEKVAFSIWDYPGYINKKGDGIWSDLSFPVGACCTFKFTKNHHIF